MSEQATEQIVLSTDAAFMLGYLYLGCLKDDNPLWLTARTFNDGSCAVWGGVCTDTGFVGSWWELSKVSPADLQTYIQACRYYLINGLPNGFIRVPVKIVQWGEW